MSVTLKEALQKGEFAVTVEMNLYRAVDESVREREVESMKAIFATGLVHAVSITDNPGGNPTITADSIARELRDAGVETLVHFSAKDRARNQVLGQLYALERDGLRNLLFMTGDCQNLGWRGSGRPVFDLDSVQLQLLATEMNAGLAFPAARGPVDQAPTHLFGGCCVNPYKYRTGEIVPQYLKMEKKLAAGARFLITQLGYDSRKLHELMLYLREQGLEVPVLANVYLLTPVGAKLMRSGSIAGCTVTEKLAATLAEEAEAEDKGRAARIERAARQIAVARGLGCAGVHIGGPGLSAESLVVMLDRAAELQGCWQDCAAELSYGIEGGGYLYPPDPLNSGLNLEVPSTIPDEDISGRKLFEHYGLSRTFHSLLFVDGKGFNGLFKGSLERREAKRGTARAHGIEHAGKALIYGCKDCGDCGLEACAYSCPMAQCPKSQRNGPCGGSIDGWCERYPGERYCIWYKAYHRLARFGGLERLGNFITPPNDWALSDESAWSNYVHERDNAAKRIPLE